ncbi:hypothetical protein BWI15_31370 [Kribbella sp. ALI-6-A]|nr:hypothetical protein BWI15_31370 [Kribbella sp. ALI-6-A]
MGVSFEGIKVRAIDLGELRRRFVKTHPVVEEHPPVPLQVERFGRAARPGIEFQFMDFPPIPMVVFLAEDRSSLIQVQGDRFHCAWRRVQDETPYPRYESFRRDFLANLQAFCAQIGHDELPITQAEINYVNDMPTDGTERPDTLANLLPLSGRNRGNAVSVLPEISMVSTSQHFTMKSGEGVEYARLHIAGEPLAANPDTVRLTFTYRGEPGGRTSGASMLEMIMGFLDEGHDQIVRSFAVNTTAEAQKNWGRAQ